LGTVHDTPYRRPPPVAPRSGVDWSVHVAAPAVAGSAAITATIKATVLPLPANTVRPLITDKTMTPMQRRRIGRITHLLDSTSREAALAAASAAATSDHPPRALRGSADQLLDHSLRGALAIWQVGPELAVGRL
jgi:hypothetical protein